MEIETKILQNTEESLSEKIIEIEMDSKKEDLEIEMNERDSKFQNIDISADLLEIKSESIVIDEKFERLGKELKMQLGNTSLEESIWAPKKEKYDHKIDTKARVISANVTDRNVYQREKNIK